MSAWNLAELDAIDRADVIDIATRRTDGTLRPARIVWVVRHGDDVYVRSVNGRDAAWYRGVQTTHVGHISSGQLERDVAFKEIDHALDDELDAAYRVKYGRYAGPTARITAVPARESALRLDPVKSSSTR